MCIRSHSLIEFLKPAVACLLLVGLIDGIRVEGGTVTIADDVSLAIPDGDLAGTLVRINVSGVPVGQGIRDLNVTLSVDGTVGFNGDLYAYLTKTDNAAFSILLNRPGRTQSNIFGSAGAGLQRLVFDDEASNGDIRDYETVIGESAIFGLPWTGSWQPDGRLVDPSLVTGTEARSAMLNQFDGIDPNGEWLLFLADVSPGGLVTLTDWALEFELDATVSPFSGVASDGLVAGGTVFFDANLNGNRDASEPWVFTDGSGDYQLNVLPGPFDQNGDGQLQASEGVLVLSGGMDIATGLPLEISFRAPLGASVIHPVTSLIAALLIRDPNLSETVAESQVETALGLDAGLAARVEMLRFDMYAEADQGNADAVAIIKAVAMLQDTIVQVGSLVSGANGVARAPTIELALDQLVEDLVAGRTLDLSSVGRVRELIDAVDGALFDKLSVKQKDTAAEIIVANAVLKQSYADSTLPVAQAVQRIVQSQVQVQSEVASDLHAAGQGTLNLQDILAKNTHVNLQTAIEGAPVGDISGNVVGVGTFSFDQFGYEVMESGTAIHPITVIREGGNAGTVRLLVTPNRGTADDTDFVDAAIEVDFAPLEIRKTIDASALIRNDAIDEGAEDMGLSLGLRAGNPQGAALGSVQSVRLSIIDDDTVGSVSFSSPQYSIREDGLVTSPITLQRSGGSFGFIPVVVRLESVNGGATAGVDFVPGDFLFTFGDGNLNQRVASMILDNQVFEGDEVYRAVLRLAPGAPGTASLGAITTTLITIVEDDPNHPPTVSQIFDQGIEEDGVLSHLPFTVGDEEHDLDSLSITAVAENGALIPASGLVVSGSGASRSLLVRPNPNQSGVSKVTVRVDDGFDATEMSFIVAVAPVNDPPFVQRLQDIQVPNGSDIVFFEFVIGDLDSPSTALETRFISLDSILLPDAAIVSEGTGFSRTIRITPPSQGVGRVPVSLNMSDELTTVSIQFLVTIVASNTEGPVEPVPASFSIAPIAPISINEDEATRVTLDVVASGNLAGPLTFRVSGGDDSLIDVASIEVVEENSKWTMVLEPRPNQNGLVELTLHGSDGNQSVLQSFQLSVSPVNDPPIVGLLPDLVMDEDGKGRVVIPINDIDSELSALSIQRLRATDSNILPASSFVVIRTELGFEIGISAGLNQWGETRVEFDLLDADVIVPVSFDVKVNSINDAPFFESLPTIQGIAGESLDGRLLFGDVDSPADALDFKVISLNNSLLPNSDIALSGVGFERFLTIVPAEGKGGKGSLLLSLTDGLTTVVETIVVTVLPATDPPFIGAIPVIELEEDTERTIEVEFGDSDSPLESLVLMADQVDSSFFGVQGVLVSRTAEGKGLLFVKPLENQTGDSQFRLSVSDGKNVTESLVTVRVSEVNDSPSISTIPDIVINGAEERTIFFSVSDPDTDSKQLIVAAVSADPSIIQIVNDGSIGLGAERELTIRSLANRLGNTEIFLGVSDGKGSALARFLVTVKPTDEPPIVVNPAPRMSISISLNGVRVSWDPSGVLEQSLDPSGPFVEIRGATSPFLINPEPGQNALFFRVTRD